MTASEQAADRAAQFLATTHDLLQGHNSPEAPRWLEEITKLQAHCTKTNTIIGIIGATGAGKSALINALLVEERILPTSCMRACTAVVTEISYNTSEIPYRAEVEFISDSQWRAELETLYGDLLDSTGRIAVASHREDNEAGIAYSKLKAVYPNLTKDQIANASIEELMRHRSAAHLGTTKIVEGFDAAEFYRELQVYIDSKEKVDLRHKSTKSAVDVLEYWPLIKVVRLYLKSHVLRSGAVLVDLPGIHDSNAARAAIAQTYLKQCSSLLIVAPITRAVDDKSAKTLLGQSFKQQLKLDGTFGNITFVCTKTDDILEAEAQDSLDIDEELGPLKDKVVSLRDAITQLANDQQEMQSTTQELSQKIQDADSELDLYLPLLLRAAREGRVTRPTIPVSQPLGKRKRRDVPTSSRKRSSITSYFVDDSDSEDLESDDSLEKVPAHGKNAGSEITRDEVERRIAELREIKLSARQQLGGLDKDINVKEKMIKEHKRDLKTARSQLTRVCIQARNEYSRAAIRQDFAAGIQEIDEELATENDPDNFDSSQHFRNYDEVAQSLPVFCVSSRGYQKLCGRLKSESKAWGFEEIADTEIPQLQAHCSQVAEDLRVAAAQAFTGKVALLCSSFRIWTSELDQQKSLTEDQLIHMRVALQTDLEQYAKNLLQISKDIMTSVVIDIEANICNKFDRAVSKAQGKASLAVARWHRPVDRNDPANSGFHWTTYGAIVRRSGLFPKKDVVHDLNKELTDPLVKKVLHGWETTFQLRVPAVFKEALAKHTLVTSTFQAAIVSTALNHGIKSASLDLLNQQLQGRTQGVKEAISLAKDFIQMTQKNINREFIPTIASEMSDVYGECAAQKGLGMYARMKSVMTKGTLEASTSMFRTCTEHIDQLLKQMMQEASSSLEEQIEHITSWVSHDYMQLCADRSQEVLAEENLLKQAIMAAINDYETGDLEVHIAEHVVDGATQTRVKIEDAAGETNSVGLVVRSTIPYTDFQPTTTIRTAPGLAVIKNEENTDTVQHL